MDELPFFSAEELTVGYDGVPLISGISLARKRGEILTLIGPNGSGKSTILKSITRHLAAIAGVVCIDGNNMRAMSNRETATRLAVVLTERIRPELMTCGELVASGRYPYTDSFGRLTAHDREVIASSLAQVHASDLYDRDFLSLSDGQKQRVLLARAICQEPEVIVLDEPTSFLDIRHKIELLDILRDMAKNRRITVLMSLHEIDFACKVSDQIMCVKDGRISPPGAPDEVFTDQAVRALYGIEKGSYDALLGSAELRKPPGEARLFLIGGCGHGIPFYRAAQKRQIPFAAGILAENDVDLRVAGALAETVVTAPAFEPFGEAELAAARALLCRMTCVADCGCPTGTLNRANGALLEYARSEGKRILTAVSEIGEVIL